MLDAPLNQDNENNNKNKKWKKYESADDSAGDEMMITSKYFPENSSLFIYFINFSEAEYLFS